MYLCRRQVRKAGLRTTTFTACFLLACPHVVTQTLLIVVVAYSCLRHVLLLAAFAVLWFSSARQGRQPFSSFSPALVWYLHGAKQANRWLWVAGLPLTIPSFDVCSLVYALWPLRSLRDLRRCLLPYTAHFGLCHVVAAIAICCAEQIISDQTAGLGTAAQTLIADAAALGQHRAASCWALSKPSRTSSPRNPDPVDELACKIVLRGHAIMPSSCLGSSPRHTGAA